MPNIVGYGNTQVPTNAMLGGMAYQDSERVVVDNVEASKIADIKTTLNDTATCIFIYDTTKDSDGGAWRKKCSTQSWYTEAPGPHRSPRKEFPSLAVIVGNTNNEIIIYDGDDPDLSMFMRFKADNSHIFGNPTCISAINVCIYFGQLNLIYRFLSIHFQKLFFHIH